MIKIRFSLKNLVELSAATLFCFIIYLCILPDEDVLDQISYSQAIFDRKGNLLRLTLSGDEKYRLNLDLDEMPPDLIKAVLLHEDRFFFSHSGFNLFSLFRAGWQTYIEGNRRIGGSTITMQLARLVYNIKSNTVFGKIRQILAALQLEFFYSKQKILECYLNLVPCGYNIEGFGAASLIYFHKDLNSLTLSEILTLACIPQDPSGRAPKEPDEENRELLEARDRLFRKWISCFPRDIKYKPEFESSLVVQKSLPFKAPHFVDVIVKSNFELSRIDTTLDPGFQELLERHVENYLERKSIFGIENASALLINFRSMEVLAMLGSADFFNQEIQGQVNGTLSKRSPGSTLKPFVYALGFDQGLIHPFSLVKDTPTSFGSYTPDNFDNVFKGPLTVKDALNKSRNVPAVYVSSILGEPDLYDFLQEAEITQLKSREHYGLSIVLGTCEVTMEELVKLYAVLANRGILRPIKYILNDEEKNTKKLLSPEACFLVLDILKDNIRPDRTFYNEYANKKDYVYWKTGTSIGYKDSWSVGIFDDYVLAVWVGNFDGSGNPEFASRRAAAPLFFEIVDSVRALNQSYKPLFDEMDILSLNVKRIEVCSVSGLLPNENCPHTVETWFIPGVSPIKTCDIHRKVYIDIETGLRTDKFHSENIREEVYEFWPSDILKLFEQAGIPRRVPPPYTDSLALDEREGNPPQIISPLSETEYTIRLNNTGNEEIPFVAVSDADVYEIFWFVDDSYVGSSAPDAPFFWKARPGNFMIKAVDDNGRSVTGRLDVIIVE
jgi:penicillin-binding protein 1C